MSTSHEYTTDIIAKLKHHGLRRTSFREDVLRIFDKAQGKALASGDIEAHLGERFDRITLYRTLKSFEEHGLVHQLIDIKGHAKYAICSHQCSVDHHDDKHAHFHCNNCGQTECLYESLKSLVYELPRGYEVDDTRVMLTGTCSQCSTTQSS